MGYFVVDMAELGQRIRTAREARGLSQEEFAARISRDQGAVSEYENGRRRLWATELPVIAQALDMPVSYFFADMITPEGLESMLLREFERLPTEKAKQTAIQFVRLLSDLETS